MSSIATRFRQNTKRCNIRDYERGKFMSPFLFETILGSSSQLENGWWWHIVPCFDSHIMREAKWAKTGIPVSFIHNSNVLL